MSAKYHKRPSKPNPKLDCSGKQGYSRHEAHKTKEWVGKVRGKDMRIYLCPTCHLYHLTKRSHDY